jgi:hypothetical protein
MPFALNDDYWLYRKMIDTIVDDDHIPVFGDSVIWGEYVSSTETLCDFLNRSTESHRFANAGLNGAHPLALHGLLRSYASSVRDRRVILHCNLLWMSSSERDLQSSRDVTFNHPRLVPQFQPIPAYRASFPQRISYTLDRNVRLFSLVQHVRTAYFEGRDLQSWIIAHPYDNPLQQIDSRRLVDEDAARHEGIPWSRQGIPPQDMPWIDLDTSLQWRAWREAAEDLRSRGNRVLVVVGPFNEHLLTPPSRQRYASLRAQVVDWLRSRDFHHVAPPALPSDEYGDASHPLAIGYERLAREFSHDPVFEDWLTGA